MRSLAVIGSSEFTLGFRLAGIRTVITASQPDQEVRELMKNENIGVIIIDEGTMNSLSERVREDVVASIAPVFVSVSEHAAQEELRKMIIQSIGVDLLKN